MAYRACGVTMSKGRQHGTSLHACLYSGLAVPSATILGGLNAWGLTPPYPSRRDYACIQPGGRAAHVSAAGGGLSGDKLVADGRRYIPHATIALNALPVRRTEPW